MPVNATDIFAEKQKNDFLCILKNRREVHEISPKICTQMGDGYGFFASVRDGVSTQHAFRIDESRTHSRC